MKTFNNEIIVRRNETFTIDKIIETRSGAPYIISNRMQNPFFLITITNSLYNQKDRYMCNVWIPIELPRFESTVPVNLADFEKLDGSKAYPYGFKNLEGLPGGYINNVNVSYEEGDAVFYWEDDKGKRIYKYWDSKNGWTDYSCRIIYKFVHEITRNWIEGSYFYNIDLVDGDLDPNATQGQRPIPISNVSEHIPILGATKLTVLTDLRGGM